MKCLHVLPMNKLSGAEKLALILCKNIEKYKPIVVCGGDELKSIFEQEGITAYSIDFKNNSLLKNISQIKKIIKENNIKIVHAHDNNASVNCYLAKIFFRLKIKVVSHIHSCYPWLEGDNKIKKIDTFFRQRYDYNIACGTLVYDYYKQNTNYIDKIRIKSLSNCIDIEEINKYKSSNYTYIRNELGIKDNEVVFGYIGRLVELKGIIPFIKMIAEYKDKFIGSKFLLIGSGEEENKIKQIINELNLEDLFILTGHQNNVYKFYDIIDIFFLPSLYEGLPMVILEAMSFGKPIVSMNVGSINELIENNISGILVDKCDYKTFVESLEYVKENKDIASEFGRCALEKITKSYNIKSYQKIISEIYDNL